MGELPMNGVDLICAQLRTAAQGRVKAERARVRASVVTWVLILAVFVPVVFAVYALAQPRPVYLSPHVLIRAYR